MAFHQAPEVDDNSMRSEASVIAARGWFRRSNGFIYRTEEPDYGVDVDAELIVKGKEASSWKFPIQIKSTGRLQIVTDQQEQLISLPFTVSRLAYLSKRLPAYGIILIYDEETQMGYFDYVDAIIQRLDNHSQRKGWRDQTSVNVLLPLQIISDASLTEIHRNMVDRHERHERMIARHGKSFNIPYLQLSQEQPAEFDLTDPLQIVLFLKKYGIFLFNERELEKLLTLFQLLHNAVICESNELLFLAVITYTTVGNLIESDYYLRKLRPRLSELSDDQRGIIQFSEVRLDFLKGTTNYKSFLQRLHTLQDNIAGEENKLIIRINALFFELNENATEGRFEINDKERIDRLTDAINASGLNEQQQHLLKVYHAESIHSFALEAFLHFNSRYQMSLSLNVEVPMDTRIAFARLSTDMMLQANAMARLAYVYAEQHQLYLLQASAAHNLGKFFFQMRYYLLMQAVAEDPDSEIDYVLEHRRSYAYSVIAYNHFIKLQMQQNAHEAVANAYELHQLCKYRFHAEIGSKTPDELLAIIRKLETDNDLAPFSSAADLMILMLADNGKKTTSMADLSDEVIGDIATNALAVYDLPADRLQNMIAELKAIRLFDQRCKNPHIELLTNNSLLHDKATKYARPTSFVLRHKRSRYETTPGSDIEVLLETHKHLLSE